MMNQTFGAISNALRWENGLGVSAGLAENDTVEHTVA